MANSLLHLDPDFIPTLWRKNPRAIINDDAEILIRNRSMRRRGPNGIQQEAMLLIRHLISHGSKKNFNSKSGEGVWRISTLRQLQGIKPRESEGGTETIHGDGGGVGILTPDAHKSGIICKREDGEKTHGKPFELRDAAWGSAGTWIKCSNFKRGGLCNDGKRGGWVMPWWGRRGDRMKCDIVLSLKEGLFVRGVVKAELVVGGG